MNNQNDNHEWKSVLDQLSAIREQEDYSSQNIDFIFSNLQSEDDRLRGAAALVAEGCVFEPKILDTLVDLVQFDDSNAIRKASLQSMGGLIDEGLQQGFEDGSGADTSLDISEEWDEMQTGTLRDDYIRVKNLLYSILNDEFDDRGVREAALSAVQVLGFLEEVREWIRDFIDSEYQSSKLVALHAMGKYPQHWGNYLVQYIQQDTPKTLLMEAISSGYASQSVQVAKQIEQLLDTEDFDILSYALLTLANINRTENLGEILQHYSTHPDEKVRQSAKEALQNYSNKNLQKYLEDELGISE